MGFCDAVGYIRGICVGVGGSEVVLIGILLTIKS